MKFRMVTIDEPIHIQDKNACLLWQKSLWLKEEGYRNFYKSNVLPVSSDDFVAKHLLVVNEKSNGTWEPIVMYKSIRLSQASKFHLPFGGTSLLKGSKFENSLELQGILSEEGDISYDSSWTMNPKYQKDKELSSEMRNYLTTFACFHHLQNNYYRWLSAGVTTYKIDQYFEWLGGKQIMEEFSLPIIDNSTVRMIYIADTRKTPDEVMFIAKKYQKEWDNRIEFKPKNREQINKRAA